MELVGREAELAYLAEAVTRCAAGHGSAIVVSGEPGIGKTCLCDALASAAEAAGVGVAWGRCWEGGGAPAFWPWTQILDALPTAPDTDDERDALAALTGRRTDGPALEPFRLFRGVRALLRREDRGLVLVLDDLHAADLATLELARFVVRAIRGTRLVVAAVWREREAAARTDAAEQLAGIAREARCLSLGPLGADDVGRLASAAGLADDAVRRVVSAGRGNPLFVREWIRMLGSGGSGAEVPLEVRQLVRQRVRACAEPTRAVLGAVSVVPGSFAVGGAARLAGVPVAVARDALHDAAAAGLVAQADGRWSFAHALIREAVYGDVPRPQRAQLHRSAADSVGDGVGDSVGDEGGDAAAAHHLLLADDAVAAAPYAIRAAHAQAALCAFPDAMALLGRVAGALAADGAPLDVQIDVALARGELAPGAAAGDLGREVSHAAAAWARTLGDAERFGQAALRYGAEFRVALIDPVLVELLREALDRLPAVDHPLRARLLARYAAAIQPAPDPNGPVALAREAIDMAARLGDEDTTYDTQYTAMSAMMDYVHPRERAPLNREVARIARARGHRLRELRCHLRLAMDALELADMDEVRRAADRYDTLQQPLDSPHLRWPVLALAAAVAGHAGALDEAGRMARDLASLGEAHGIREARACGLIQDYFWGRYRRDGPASDAAFDHLIATLPPDATPNLLCLRAWHHGALGRVADSRATLDQLRALGFVGDPAFLVVTARAAWLAGDEETGRAALQCALGLEDRWVSFGILGMLLDGPYVRHVGLGRAAAGNLDGAVAALDEALARVDRAELRTCWADVAVDLAEVLERRGSAGDETRARTLRDGVAALPWNRTADPVGPAPIAAAALALDCQGDTWVLSWPRGSMTLKDSRGVQLLARLVAEPGRELHVLDLAGAAGHEDELRGDAGPMLDPSAIAAYRARVEDLEDALAEAESYGDELRAERARAELDALAEELSRSVGLGGRERRTGSAAERARSAVTRRIREVVKRIAERDAALGRWLEASVVTGAFCAFRPVTAAP